MMRNVVISKTCVAVIVVCVLTFSASSHEHATGIVKERMDLMAAIGKRMKSINAHIKEKRQLNTIKDDARAIAESAPHIAHLFPPGSTQHPTEAKTTIWQNFQDFESKAKVLEAESAKLAQLSENDFAALAAQVRTVSLTCSGCHESYRVKKR